MVIVEVSLSPPSPDASAASLLKLAGPPLAGRFSFALRPADEIHRSLSQISGRLKIWNVSTLPAT